MDGTLPGRVIWSLWRFEPLPLAATLAAALLYGLAAGPLRAQLFPGRPFPTFHAARFYAGLALLTLVFVSPLHTLGEFFLLSAHMLTLLLVIFAVAPLVLSGLPGWLITPLLRHPALRPALRFLTRPAVNVVHFNMAFALLHVPQVLGSMMFGGELLHYYSYALVFGAALLMWWPIINPVPGLLPSPSPRAQLGYLLALILAHNPFSSVLTFAPGLLYPWYARAPRVFGLSPLQDQHLSGVLMGVTIMTVLLVAMAVVFARWFGAGREAAVRVVPPARAATDAS